MMKLLQIKVWELDYYKITIKWTINKSKFGTKLLPFKSHRDKKWFWTNKIHAKEKEKRIYIW